MLPSALMAVQRPGLETPVEALSFPGFERYLETSFAIYPEEGSAILATLVEVERTEVAHPRLRAGLDSGNEKFSLIFQAPRETLLEQGIHSFEHQHLGRFAIFIVPILSRDVSHYYYEAIFNRPPAGRGQMNPILGVQRRGVSVPARRSINTN